MGTTYMNFGTGVFHVDGDAPLTQEQVDSVWLHLPTTGASWVEKGHLFVQQRDDAAAFNLGPVEPGVRGVSDSVRLHGNAGIQKSKTHHATRKVQRHHATKKSPAQLDREIAEALSQETGMTTEQIAGYRSGRKWGWPADLSFKVATGRSLSRTPGRRAHATRGTQKIPSFKIATKDPAAMTAAEINKELDKLNEQDSTLGSLMIEAGRGHERPSEYLKMTDPLAMELRKNADRRQDLRIEIDMRYGPNSPSRLPSGRGFGPRSKTQSPTRGGMGFGKRFGGD